MRAGQGIRPLTQMPFETLSQRGGQVQRFRCEFCRRHGAYRADRLMAIVGDVTLADAMTKLALSVGCPRALNPPNISSINYNLERCQIRVDIPPPKIPPTIGRAMHEHWRGYISCARHHQGLKRAKPCGVERELDLATLVAALGYDFEIERLSSKLSAPCCGSRMFELRWYRPAIESSDAGASGAPERLRHNS